MENILNHRGTVQLETDRLILRRLTVRDARKVFDNWTSDHEVAKFMRWNTHTSIDATINWLKECEANAENLTFYDWGIIASGAVLTHVGFVYAKDGVYTSFDGTKNYPCKIYYLDMER